MDQMLALTMSMRAKKVALLLRDRSLILKWEGALSAAETELLGYQAASVGDAELAAKLYDSSLNKAKAEKKLVLLDFTGSDWCQPCMALRKNVLNSPEFKGYAQTNLVLVELDFPIKKKQTEELKKANEELGSKFKVEGYPTIILLEPDGTQLLKTMEAALDTPKEFIARLEKAKKKAP